jgi:phospholipid/cholesterol/gamma-HCH transport system substrate-binding protein
VRARKLAAVVIGSVFAGVVSSGCLFQPVATITTTAYFSDVGDLVAGAPVEVAGVPVGNVRSISLDGNRAKVVLAIDEGARVPADVEAEAEQSTVLGQEVVELVAPRRAAGVSSSLLSDGSVIYSTTLVPGIQQFVSGGTAVLGSIGTSQLSTLVDAGGEGFGGEALELRHLISNLDTAMAGYASRDGEIRTLVSSMNELDGSLAPRAGADGEAIHNLARTIGILNAQSQNFLHLLRGLDALSVEGHSLLTDELSQIDFQLSGLAGVTATLNGQQAAIAELVEQLPGHDMVMHDTTVNNFSQVVDSIIVCGLPDGGSSSQAASNCYGAGGQPSVGSLKR